MKFDRVMKLTRDEYARKTHGKATPDLKKTKVNLIPCLIHYKDSNYG